MLHERGDFRHFAAACPAAKVELPAQWQVPMLSTFFAGGNP